MNPLLTMSTKEASRLKILSCLSDGDLTVGEAAEMMALSVRQTYRLLHRYRTDGDGSVIHRLRGRPSNRGYPSEKKQWVVQLYWSQYRDFGPKLFTEQLAKRHKFIVDHETVRRWLNAHGGAAIQRKKRSHRRKRERRSAIGSLVQFDGSHHEWFEERGRRCCVLHAVDDASGRVFLRFVESENSRSVLQTVKEYIQRFGIPHAFYVDRGSVFYAENKLTDFQRAMNDLGVQVIFANSPQAKGRVERGNRTHQDRLLRLLRLEGISTIDQANAYLDQVYLQEHNTLYAKTEGLPDVHTCPDGLDLDRIFSFQTTRYVHNDATISLKGGYVQLERGRHPLPPPKHTVTVCTYLDGSVHIFWGKEELAWTMITEKPQRPKPVTTPSDSHPWRHARPIGKAKRHTIAELCRKS